MHSLTQYQSVEKFGKLAFKKKEKFGKHNEGNTCVIYTRNHLSAELNSRNRYITDPAMHDNGKNSLIY